MVAWTRVISSGTGRWHYIGTAIRAAYQQRGEFSAAVELRRRFPGITDNAQAREWARTIAGWKPLPLRPKQMLKVPPSRL
jgi:hypothetical protein